MTRNRDKYAQEKGDRGKYAFVELPYHKKCFFDPMPVPSTRNIVLVKYTEKKNFEFLVTIIIGEIILFLGTW
jgi:hypothetical protein